MIALNHSTQKTWENFVIVLNLKLPGLRVNCYKDCYHLKMTRLCYTTEWRTALRSTALTSFTTALSRQEISPPTAGWKCNTSLFPKISKDVIKTYQSNKRQGMIGQFRKAHRMFSSRRMKTIKVFKNGSQLFVKSSILKSFSSEVTRTATVLFIDNVPKKGFWECAVVSVVMLSLYCYS